MARDYGRKPPRTPRKGTLSSKLLIVLLSFFGGYLTATLFDFSQLTALIEQHFSKPKPKQITALKQQKPEINKPKFEFYTLLSKESNQLVPVNKTSVSKEAATLQKQETSAEKPGTSLRLDAVKPQVVESKPLEIPAAANKKNGAFLVQVAAFNRRQDAEQIKAALVLTGYDVSLAPVIKNNVTWYRVIIGPFSSQKEAEKARLMIAHSHKMNGMVRRA